VNADGLDDLGCWSQSGSNALTYYLHNGASTPPDLATSFVDGFGNSVKPAYVSISQPGTSYNAWNDQVFPYQNWLGAYYVVEYSTFSDPSSTTGATYYQQYWYAGASMNLQGRGFAGFGAQQRYDSRSGVWETWDYTRVFPYTGMLNGDVAAQDNFNAKPINWRTNTLTYLALNGTANNERYFPYASTTTINSYEVGGTKNTDLITSTVINNGTPDSYGNFDTVSTTVTDKDSQSPVSPNNGNTWTSKTVSTVAADTSTWCLGLPTEVQVTNSSTATGGTAITRTVNYTPDYTNCRETQKVVAPGTAYQVTEAYGFDSFGNLSGDTVTGTGMTARTTGTTWGTTGQFPTVITNPLGQTVTQGHDPNTGKLTSQTDPNYTSANPLTTTWAYDGFGRKTQETRTDGTYTTWTYNDCATFGGCLFGSNALAVANALYASNGTLLNNGTTYFDTVNRPVMANQKMLSGAYSRIDKRYDSLGRLAQQSMPCTYAAVATACTYWTTNSYDVLNRPTQSQRPISATNSTLQTTTFGYAGRTSTVKDPLGNTTTKISLVTGPLARSQDPAGYYQNFTYDAFGALTAVKDSASNALFSASYAYGAQAFQTAATDMDLGARSYTVDPLGEVTAWTDAKSQSFSTTYDALSRPLVRTEPDLTTTWTWGSTAASYNIGKLASVTAAGSSGTWSDTDTYDSLGRPSTEIISNPGDRTYTYAWTYDPHSGLLASLQYPVDISFILTLQYAYTNGILQSISSNSYSPAVTYWTANATNPAGQVTQETLGNGVVINRNFDAVTGWLGSVQAGPGGGSGLQNNSFLYDYDGNVTQREDNNQGLTENFYYDADNRFSYSTLGGATNLQVAYDTTGMGNIVGRSDVAGGAAWTYDSVRKHAVTQAGSSAYTYTYDANGNAITRNGSAITWSSYNYPTSVSTASESVDFYYGGDRQRWKEVYTNANGTETTYHAGKLFEVAYYLDGGTVLAHYRHYVYAGNELVSIDDRSTAATPQYYVVSDHQGSYASIENSASPGTNFVSESFTAFGNRRSGETWSGAPTTTDESNINIVSRRGFTGESMLGISMGLNHLNGRVEDAITGRFLSPDPTIPNPGDTQSFNRYSYVNNRPLTMVDPSGFTPKKGTCNLYCPGDIYWSGAASGTNGGSALGSADSGGDGFDDVFGSSGGGSGPTASDSFASNPGGGASGNSDPSDPPASGSDSAAADSSTGGTVATDTTGSGTTTVSSGAAQSQGSVGLGMSAAQAGAFPLAGTSIDEISEIEVTANVVGGVPSGVVAPPDNVPNGPWQWNPNPQNPRGGNWMGPKQPKGGRWTITFSPATRDQRAYWKSNGPDGSVQRYDENGNPMSVDQKQWGPNEVPDDWLPTAPFSAPSLNPWWWLFFSAPAH
jgi:RHS repeat-associated protein